MKNNSLILSRLLAGFCLHIFCSLQVFGQDTFSLESKAYAHRSIENGTVFVQVEDPLEQAFRVKMPVDGWCTAVGLVRNYGIVYPLGYAVQAYGSSRLFFGDYSAPIYLYPDSEMKQLAENNPQIDIKAIMSPSAYVRMYLEKKYQDMGIVEILEIVPDPELDEIMEKRTKSYPEVDFGLSSVCVSFELESDHWAMKGQVSGELNCTVVSTDTYWGVELSGFTTLGDSVDLHGMLRTMLHSYETDASWLQRRDRYQPRPALYTHDDTSLYSTTPEAFLGAIQQGGGWRYYWIDKNTGEVRPSDIPENPDPARYKRWHKPERCKQCFF